MAIRMSDARALCSKAELELVLKTTAKAITEMTSAQLRSAARRARSLRDKFGTLAARQRRVARGKQTPRGMRPSRSNDNTVKKRDIFQATLEKFEAKLETLERRDAAAARKKTTKKKVATKAKVGAATGASRGKSARSVARKAGAGLSLELVGPSRPVALPITDTLGTIAARDLKLASKSRSSRASRAEATKNRANLPKIHGHISADVRKAQAKRDYQQDVSRGKIKPGK